MVKWKKKNTNSHIRQGWSVTPAEPVCPCLNNYTSFTEMPQDINNMTCVKCPAEVDVHQMNPLAFLFWPGSLSMGGDPTLESRILQLWVLCYKQPSFWGILVTGNCVQLIPAMRKLYSLWLATACWRQRGPLSKPHIWPVARG